jgi:enoyl-CoA hydratase/carnithine racemase
MSDFTTAVERTGHVAVITFSRAPANMFDEALLRSLADLAEEAQSSGARAIVLASDGKHFCAGQNFGVRGQGTPREVAAGLYKQGTRLLHLDVPVVAAVQGAAVGGGLGLACAADFRVASAASRFEANFARLGFHHGFALSVTLPHLVGNPNAERMLLAAARVGGEEAHRIGLVDRLVAEGAERAGALELANELAAGAPLAVRAMRRTLRAGLVAQVDAALAHELDEQTELWKTEDAAAGIRASLTRTAPEFVGR